LFLIIPFFFSIQNTWASSSTERDEYIKEVLSKFEKSSPAVTPNKKTEAPQNKHTFEVGSEIYRFIYKEPGLMKDKGIMKGINFAYVFHGLIPPDVKNGMLKIEGRYSRGKVDYDGGLSDGTPLTVNNIPDYMLEFRVLFGNDFLVSETLSFTPYIGIGHRYLNDNMHKKYAGGYERESRYIYFPIGIELTSRFERGWSLAVHVECDAFAWGRQKSHMTDFSAGYGDITNSQHKGYGLRGSFKIQKKGQLVGFIIEPFIRYWNIEDSEYVPKTFYGVPDPEGKVWVEPENNSTEFGLKLALDF
jgi:hypothetical protein